MLNSIAKCLRYRFPIKCVKRNKWPEFLIYKPNDLQIINCNWTINNWRLGLRKCALWLATNSWGLRNCVLWLATLVYLVAVGTILIRTMVTYKTQNPLAVCFPKKHEDIYHSLSKGSAYYYFTVIILGLVSIFMFGVHVYLLKKGERVFLWGYLDKSQPPFHQTIYFTASLLLSLVPSAFKYYKMGRLVASLGLTWWYFLMQIYLQPKCDIGLFSTSVSAGLSILCGNL